MIISWYGLGANCPHSNSGSILTNLCVQLNLFNFLIHKAQVKKLQGFDEWWLNAYSMLLPLVRGSLLIGAQWMGPLQ